jgi:hypothetical protein
MKRISKFMAIALAVGALSSCSDELIEKSPLKVKDGDLVATLPLTGDATRVAVVPGTPTTDFVWSGDDQIQVYKLDNLNYTIYDLTDGAGSETGVFSTTGEPQNGDDLYAVTQPQFSETIYGVSADDAGNAVLTATIEKQYNWDVLNVQGGGLGYIVPTPFWGNATIDGNNINVAFKALTGFMKLDLANVPATTKAIVLTTHEDFSIDGGTTKVNGGSNEPLSGTLRATLDDDAALAVDKRLAKYDEIRIDIPEHAIAKGYILYIPVVAQHYDKLFVLAVTDDVPANYTWQAEILREFDDFTQTVYKNGKVSITSLSLSEMISLNAEGANSWASASIVIAAKAAQNPGRTMRFTADATGWGGDGDKYLYIADNMENNNVELTITAGTAPQYIVENSYGVNILSPFAAVNAAVKLAEFQALENDQMKKARTVRLNYQVAWPAETQVLLPTSNVELNSTVDQTNAIQMFTASTTGVSGYDETVYNAKNAGLIIKGGVKANGTPVDYKQIDILANSRGDIYAYQEDTYIETLNFLGTEYLQNIRLTDALVGVINYTNTVDDNEEINIYTTGSAAIGKTGAEAITGSHKNKPAVYAYWTNRSLTDNAIDLGFDSGLIYTAAQLQGVGLAAGLYEGGGTFTFASGNALTTLEDKAKYEYQIDKFVNNIWLGGAQFPWLGAQVAKLVGTPITAGYGTNRNIIEDTEAKQALSKDVSINGNGKRLRNMVISTDNPYFHDPHTCCTTCGDLSVKVTEDLGLFRCIMSTKTVTVQKIYLNDALLDTDAPIDDIGSIAGHIYGKTGVTYENNISTNIRISAVGDNIGGQVGLMRAISGAIAITNPKNNQETAETAVPFVFVESEGNNVGGIVGAAIARDNKVDVENAIAMIDWVLAEEGSNAGGVIGVDSFALASTINSAFVEIPSIMATQSDKTEAKLRATGKNVGGLVGFAVSKEDKDLEVKGTVSVESISEIEAGNQNAGGLFGLVSLDADASSMETGILKIGINLADEIDVDVDDLTAKNGYAGGYAGNISTGKEAKIGSTEANANAAAAKADNVHIGSLNSAFAAGGLIGGNSIPVTISAAEFNTIDVDVDDITNTWTEDDFKGVSTYSYLNINLDNRLKNCGSFGLLVGLENSKDLTTGLTVNTHGTKVGTYLTTGGDATATTTAATQIMNYYETTELGVIFKDAKKQAVFFKLHSDTGSTVPEAATDFYWGDVYGYTGYVKGDNRYVVDGDLLQGDQIFNVATQW